ncbi:MAG: carboxylating nicotinate-nucleotide diphosphorylase [Chloroflexi bacterium]|nr:carboxylating nicotinate-nucleotide diphosphorylase [Chloroflexota bacterium]
MRKQTKTYLPLADIDRIVDIALAEDTAHGDVTSDILMPPDLKGKASVLVKAPGVLAGIEVAKRVFLKVDPTLKFEVLIQDGTKVKPGDVAAVVSGNLKSILKAERVALNFLQRLSGIATQTALYVEQVRGLDVYIADTRKTTPGLRMLEKYAVRMGGGRNHRFHLGDGVLIKDNHIAVLRATGMSLKEIIAKARREAPGGLKVEAEVTSAKEALDAVEAGADIIMLDNMSLEEMRRAVSMIKGKAKIEASGGVTLDNVRAVAETGVDFISVGALTHSPKALDISLEVEVQPGK